jgi:hypothetical protein
MNLSTFLLLIQKLIDIFTSKGVPEQNVIGITTSSQPQNIGKCVVRVVRNRQTSDATMGSLKVDGYLEFKEVTLERTAVMIPEGQYIAQLELSPHFGFLTPHLSVPGRTYIEQHPANFPSQLEGCQAIGLSVDGDAIDNSDVAFAAYVKLLPQNEPFLVVVSSSIT